MVSLHEEGLPIDEEFIRSRVSKNDFNNNILVSDILSAKPIINNCELIVQPEIKEVQN